ncbi:MAG: hypothetical protein NZM38_03630 [Cytophagales bacterium]|nr:hypothetical protein [Cytophagales bacterium]MDW8383843.1 hypothetical protein [Flammeovirgaceae bacterium]
MKLSIVFWWILLWNIRISHGQKLCGDLKNFVKDGEEIVFYAFAYIEPLYSRQLRVTNIFEIRYVVDSNRNLNDAITNHLAVEFEQYLRGTRPNGIYTRNGYAWNWQNRGVVRCPNLEFVKAARAEMIREYIEKNKYDDMNEEFRQKGWKYRRNTDRQEFQNVIYHKRELIYPYKPFSDSTNYKYYNNYPYYNHFSPYNMKKQRSSATSVEDLAEKESMEETSPTDSYPLKRRQVIEEMDFTFEYPMNQYYKGKTIVMIKPIQ